LRSALSIFLLILLPKKKEFGVAFSKEIVSFFDFGFYGVLYGAFNELFCFRYKVCEIGGVNMVTNKKQMDYSGILTIGVIAGNVNSQDITQSLDDLEYDLVETKVFEKNIVNVVVKRVQGICLKDFFISILACG
jgi:hypothetical protein